MPTNLLPEHPSSSSPARVLPALFLALVFALLAPSSAKAIVNGKPAKLADFPYFTVVGDGCGGALIRPDRVLTAAHCLEVIADNPTVRIGPRMIKRRILLRATLPLHFKLLKRMQREFPPPAGDLMLLELNRPVRGVPLAEIASAKDGLTGPGTTVLTIGRGATSPDGRGQGVFRAGMVRIEDPSRCGDELPTSQLRAWSLCTRDSRMADRSYRGRYVSACVGDSGSPLLASHEGGYRLVGVVSWGPSCGTQKDPEIYANAVRGRGFAIAANPPWAPAPIGRPRITGKPTVGATVRCQVRWRVRPTRRLIFSFYLDGRELKSGPSNRLRIPRSARYRRLTCDATGETPGGRAATPLAQRVRIR